VSLRSRKPAHQAHQAESSLPSIGWGRGRYGSGIDACEDLGRLEGILDALAAGYGAGATVRDEELLPFLGEAGAVPPWELTDAARYGSALMAT